MITKYNNLIEQFNNTNDLDKLYALRNETESLSKEAFDAREVEFNDEDYDFIIQVSNLKSDIEDMIMTIEKSLEIDTELKELMKLRDEAFAEFTKLENMGLVQDLNNYRRAYEYFNEQVKTYNK